MNRFYRIPIYILMVSFMLIGNISPAMAIPALPSTFYGKVKHNNFNVPDGTVIQAYINDQLVATGYSQLYEGDSYYLLNIPGDNSETNVIEGGRDGDKVTFKVGGLIAFEFGTWHSGTNLELNLTITSAFTLEPPRATPSSLPSQTAMSAVLLLTNTPASTIIESPSERWEGTESQLSSSSPIDKPGPTLFDENEQMDNNGQGSGKFVQYLVISSIVIIIGILVYSFLRRK